jgi:hypothetical protein
VPRCCARPFPPLAPSAVRTMLHALPVSVFEFGASQLLSCRGRPGVVEDSVTTLRRLHLVSSFSAPSCSPAAGWLPKTPGADGAPPVAFGTSAGAVTAYSIGSDGQLRPAECVPALAAPAGLGLCSGACLLAVHTPFFARPPLNVAWPVTVPLSHPNHWVVLGQPSAVSAVLRTMPCGRACSDALHSSLLEDPVPQRRLLRVR